MEIDQGWRQAAEGPPVQLALLACLGTWPVAPAQLSLAPITAGLASSRWVALGHG
jgi:hypothetical protein